MAQTNQDGHKMHIHQNEFETAMYHSPQVGSTKMELKMW